MPCDSAMAFSRDFTALEDLARGKLADSAAEGQWMP